MLIEEKMIAISSKLSKNDFCIVSVDTGTDDDYYMINHFGFWLNTDLGSLSDPLDTVYSKLCEAKNAE